MIPNGLRLQFSARKNPEQKARVINNNNNMHHVADWTGRSHNSVERILSPKISFFRFLAKKKERKTCREKREGKNNDRRSKPGPIKDSKAITFSLLLGWWWIFVIQYDPSVGQSFTHPYTYIHYRWTKNDKWSFYTSRMNMLMTFTPRWTFRKNEMIFPCWKSVCILFVWSLWYLKEN